MSDSINTIRLLMTCPDRRGITAAVTSFIAKHGGNLLDLDQHTVSDHGEFFLRAEFEPHNNDLDLLSMLEAFQEIATHHEMHWKMEKSSSPRRVAVLVGKELHCLQDLMWRFDSKDMPGELMCVISNHEQARDSCQAAEIPFIHLPIHNGDKAAQEAKVHETLIQHDVNLVVLARYMQILSEEMIRRWQDQIINVHHSFLPAFPGSDPYRQAHDRGVKMIGATAHYATPELDAGPIIAQAVDRASHRDSVTDLRRTGRELERRVLNEAVHAHLEDRVLITGNRTIVFT